MSYKPQLNFWQIWNLCFGFFGIQFGFALQNANVSRIFQILGAPIDDIPILWVAAPITGLVVQPIIGYMSDRTWNRFGRRRPYFLLGALMATLALVVMPNSPSLWIAAGMLWILDASLNIALGPSIALVGDMLPDEQRSVGFSMQSFFIGVSAVIASALPWLLNHVFGISNTAAPGQVPPSVTYAFYLGAGVLLLSLYWTAWSTPEYPPQRLEDFAACGAVPQLPGSESPPPFARQGAFYFALGAAGLLLIFVFQLEVKLHILSGGLMLYGLLQWAAGRLHRRGLTDNAVYQITRDLMCMPRIMRQLALVQCLSWFALFSMWIYATAAVTDHHYHTRDTASLAYGEGADWVGVLFAGYNGFAAVAALIIPVLVRRTGARATHVVCLLLGALGLASFWLIDNPQWLLLSMLGVGFAWASILALPLAMLTSALPAGKMGVYAGIYNFFIVIPQILASSVLALVVTRCFAGQPIYAIVCAGGFMLLAAMATLLVDEPVGGMNLLADEPAP